MSEDWERQIDAACGDWLERIVWRWDRWRIRRLAARKGITYGEAQRLWLSKRLS